MKDFNTWFNENSEGLDANGTWSYEQIKAGMQLAYNEGSTQCGQDVDQLLAEIDQLVTELAAMYEELAGASI